MSPDEEFAAHQRQTAAELGYGGDVDAMNRDHDPLHASFCAWLGVDSLSLRAAAGEELPDDLHVLAVHEEAAVMAVQKFMRHAGVKVPRP